jgi:CheY-like chemotaxis protein
MALHVTSIAILKRMAAVVRRILLVEDSAEIREIWRRVLASSGYQVVEASNGAEGLREARRIRADLIVMDLSMPVVDGITAIKQLKADSTTASVPIVVVSGDAFAAGRARAAGGEAFLAKPVRTSELLAAIARTLAQTGGEN